VYQLLKHQLLQGWATTVYNKSLPFFMPSILFIRKISMKTELKNTAKPFRILSLDGGGIKGVFQASFLSKIETAIDDKISNYFDLIVGTSTGGIIALGLGLGFTAKQMLEFYENSGPKIFRKHKFKLGLGKKWFTSLYNQDNLRKSLEEIIGSERLLGESTKRLVIPTFNLDTGEVQVYKTSHNPRLEYE